jgi:hypothetical protein
MLLGWELLGEGRSGGGEEDRQAVIPAPAGIQELYIPLLSG